MVNNHRTLDEDSRNWRTNRSKISALTVVIVGIVEIHVVVGVVALAGSAAATAAAAAAAAIIVTMVFGAFLSAATHGVRLVRHILSIIYIHRFIVLIIVHERIVGVLVFAHLLLICSLLKFLYGPAKKRRKSVINMTGPHAVGNKPGDSLVGEQLDGFRLSAS